MKKEDLLHLANLLQQFTLEYGEEITGQSEYIETDKITCGEVLEKIAKLVGEKNDDDVDELMEIFYGKKFFLNNNDDKEVDRAVDLEVDKLMEENEEVSEDYPLGGMIEPYDIWKEDELTK